MLLEEIFTAAGAAAGAGAASGVREPVALADSDPVTIIYTSGTSGESKGVVLNAGNVTYMLSCTMARLDLLMGKRAEPDRVFHYLPFCFAGSWILLLTSLLRTSELRLCDGPFAPGRRFARGRARLLPQCAATARADAFGRGSANRQAGRDIEQDIREGEGGFAGARERRRRRHFPARWRRS